MNMSKSVAERTLLVFEVPKPDMMITVQDLINLFENGFKEPKFVNGIVRSFISTGCMPMYNSDNSDAIFHPQTIQKTSGTIILPCTSTISSVITNENSEIVDATNDMLDYDSDDDASSAMRFILDYTFEVSEAN